MRELLKAALKQHIATILLHASGWAAHAAFKLTHDDDASRPPPPENHTPHFDDLDLGDFDPNEYPDTLTPEALSMIAYPQPVVESKVKEEPLAGSVEARLTQFSSTL